jgi:UDP-N-acetylmuramoyl-tripeptide--D-alanyl-D-alanine ligase
MLWTSEDAARATGGRVTKAWAAGGISIDTRTLQPGDLFVALTAARDGHDFVAAALAAGAAAAMVDRVPDGVPPDAPLLVVDDVLRGLEALGHAARARTGAKVVGVTGSVGKTSTKEMLRTVLARHGPTHASVASYNNHWGVPLTLARMPPDAAFAVIEIGMNHAGEIAPLARQAQLDVALITTVGPAHLEALGSIEAIAREKASIMDGLRAGGVAVLNADVPTSPILWDKARSVGARIIGFGANAEDYVLGRVTLVEGATCVQATRKGVPILFKVATLGAHFAPNALAVIAVAEALGLDPAVAAMDIASWQPPAGRGTRERIVTDIVEETFFDLIDDAFNANPSSLAASLDMLLAMQPVDGPGRVSAGRRIAVLGDMLELGPDEAAMHAAVARHAGLAGITVIHCVGPRMRHLWAVLPRGQRGEWVETAAELALRARSLVDAGDVVLVKGSKGSKVSLVVDALRKLAKTG